MFDSTLLRKQCSNDFFAVLHLNRTDQTTVTLIADHGDNALTADINHELNDTSAVRINLMKHQSQVVDPRPGQTVPFTGFNRTNAVGNGGDGQHSGSAC